ncbi:MAG: glycosyltransferase [Actinobacteria bacterium]|nr:glycosyltransferase [Actinomycetota bacterium]
MRILVVSPGFHGYASSFGRTFASLGHHARVHVYDRARAGVDRVGMRLLHRRPEHVLAQRTRRNLTDRAIDALRMYRPDAVLVVRGDLLDQGWWDALSGHPARRVTWMYDELRRMTYSDDTLGQIGVLATYSALDAEALRARGVHAHHVPLGFDALEPILSRPTKGISLIGARYPSREQALRQLVAAGIEVTAFGRDWSRHPVDMLRTGAYARPGVRTGRELSRGQAYGAMRDSVATLNLHGDQDGFTMRTFEAAGVGAVEICDRPDIDRFYEPGVEVLSYASADELVEQCRRVVADPRWADGIRERGRARTLDEHTLAHRLRRLEQLWV